MATAATAETSKNSPPVRVPPEEKFWQHYSPHQEMPLSAMGSFLLHALVIGGMVVLAWLGWLGFSNRKGSLPVEPVRFGQVGGGGGKTNGVGNGPGIGQQPQAAEAETKPDQPEQPLEPEQNRPKLDPNAVTSVPDVVKNDPSIDFKRYVQSGNPNLNIFKVNAQTLNKWRDGLNPGKGLSGPGSGGGQGNGDGTGKGDGRGPGTSGALTQREKRMLRWSMIFDTRSGLDYVTQLRALGAYLAIPDGDGKTYKVIRDLTPRQARPVEEDVSKLNRIFWIDDRPESVRSVMQALGLNLQPSHFVAFMPEALEEELFKMEMAFKGRTEDQVHETKFRVRPDPRRGYWPRVDSQTGR